MLIRLKVVSDESKPEKSKKNRQGVPVKRESRQREWGPDDSDRHTKFSIWNGNSA